MYFLYTIYINVFLFHFQILGLNGQMDQLRKLFQKTGVLLYYIVNCYRGVDSVSLKIDIHSLLESVGIVLCQVKGRIVGQHQHFRPTPAAFIDKVPTEGIDEHYKFSIHVLRAFINNLTDIISAYDN